MPDEVQIPDKTWPMIIWCGPTDGNFIRQSNFEHMLNIVINIVPADGLSELRVKYIGDQIYIMAHIWRNKYNDVVITMTSYYVADAFW